MPIKDENWIFRRKKLIDVGSVIVLGLGGVILLWSIIMFSSVHLANQDHITDQDLPIRDLENATYTWTAEEIRDQVRKASTPLYLGAGVFFAGYLLLLTNVSDIKLHKEYCPEETDGAKYCPDCGLRLSRLLR